jgi:hypothetical protein
VSGRDGGTHREGGATAQTTAPSAAVLAFSGIEHPGEHGESQIISATSLYHESGLYRETGHDRAAVHG